MLKASLRLELLLRFLQTICLIHLPSNLCKQYLSPRLHHSSGLCFVFDLILMQSFLNHKNFKKIAKTKKEITQKIVFVFTIFLKSSVFQKKNR